ncbi:MAG: hypothetical protein DCF27_04320 [Lysobacteraceae bacterium]|nr:MAG: hypothetical protein DCF27_04320 [Xanthomonadaceae bacterium]
MSRNTLKRRTLLPLAVLLAIAAPAQVLAQDASGQDLEARIAQLEQLVQGLKTELDAQKAATVAATTTLPAGPQPVQASTLMPAANPGTRFGFGGFIELDAMLSDTSDGELTDDSAGRLLYLPSTTPVGGSSEAGPDLDVHAQFSRFWFAADTDIDGHKVKGYIEADLFGNANGNEQSTNTYGLTLRHAYVGWDKWLAGQTWSNFQDAAALPDAVDFIGPTEGTVFVRQAQLRYTSGPWSASLEKPETTVTPYLVGARISSDDNSLPDATVRYLHKADWGHFTVAGLVRQLKYQTPLLDESDSAFALSVSGKWNIGANDDIRYMVSYGSGIGRYLGLGLGSDALQAADGSLQALDGRGGYIAWRHAFNPRLRGNLFVSAASYDNDPLISGLAVTRSACSIHANLVYTVLPKLEIGAEFIHGTREIESGLDGVLRRLHMHVKYNF